MPKLYYKDPSTGEFIEYTPVAKIPQEWKDKVDEKVDDVQINGTSIVQDGVAEIPVANSNQKMGLMRGSQTYGIDMDMYGYLRALAVADVNYPSLDNRAFISKRTLDLHRNTYVSNALTDSNKMILSDAEKSVACQTIGAEPKKGEWVLKGVMTDPNGINVDFSGCTEFLVKGFVVATATNCSLANQLRGMLYNCTLNGGRVICASFVDFELGIMSPYAKGESSSGGTAVNLAGNLSAYLDISGTKVSDITLLRFTNPTNITSCNIEIYAR